MKLFNLETMAVWVPFQASGSVPANSIVKIDNTTTVSGQKVYNVSQFGTTFTRGFGITGPMAGAKGMMAVAGEAIVKYTGSVATDETLGPTASAWTAIKNGPGSLLVRSVDATNLLALVLIQQENNFLVKGTSAIAKGSSGTVTLYRDASTSSGFTVTATALGAAYTANKWGVVQYFGTTAYLAPWEC